MFFEIILAGLIAIRDYIATHVLTCLVPAFLLAGGVVTFIDKNTVVHYLGKSTNRFKSFFIAVFSSFFIAACSCTIVPISAGLYAAGAAVGVSFIILWVAPATNILALVYTGNILGGQILAARVVMAILMAIVVGSVMSFLFDTEVRNAKTNKVDSERLTGALVLPKHLLLLFLILLSILLPNYVIGGGRYLYKVLLWLILTIVIFTYAFKFLKISEIRDWLHETLWFFRMIFPLLMLGVFIVGIVGKIFPASIVRTLVGGNSLRSSFFATLFGAVSYFATMTESPFVDTLMKLGMGKGPALSLLLTGPGLSLPNMLAIGRIFGAKKTIVYVILIIILGTVAGWLFGGYLP